MGTEEDRKPTRINHRLVHALIVVMAIGILYGAMTAWWGLEQDYGGGEPSGLDANRAADGPSVATVPYSVLIVPLGVAGEDRSIPDDATLTAMVEDLRKSVDFDYTIAEPVKLPRRFLTRHTGQMRVDLALDEVSQRYEGKGYFRVMGITAQDITIPDYNFLFGLAQRPGLACVVSVERLAWRADAELRRQRIANITLHELGHTLGLSHTPDKQSVMVYSDSLDELDASGRFFTERDVELLVARRPDFAGRVFAHGSGPGE